MSKVEAVILSTKPFRPTDFNEKAMVKVIDESYLIADVKKDGVRLNLCVGSRQPLVNVEWLSREGKRFPALVQYLQADPRWDKFYNPILGEGMFSASGFMLDAELILTDAEGNEKKCKNISGDLRRKEEPVPMDRIRVYVFDIVPLDVIESSREYEVMTSVRKMHVEYQVAKLKEIFPEIDWRVAETYEVFSMETLPVMQRESLDEDGNVITVDLPPPLSANHLYEVVRERGEEGLVMKDPMGNYRRSKCSGWWKMVPDDNEDGVVEDVIWGTEGLANEGKVIGFKVKLESGHVVNACKISRALMDEFTDTETRLPGYYKGHTVRVTFMERYPDGSLRHPSFDCFRGISSPTTKE
jgi:hypothetical protein